MPMFRKIRAAHPDLPIIMMSRPDGSHLADKEPRNAIIRKTYETAVASGDKNVYFIDGIELFEDGWRDLCTVDGCHPTDIGFFFMAKRVLQLIEEEKILP